MIYCKGLSFNFGECPYFKQVLTLARFSPKDYAPPKKNIVAGPLLDLTFEKHLQKDFSDLMVDADVFGLGFFGDAATIKKSPLVNVLATGHHVPAMVVEVIDCTDRLLEGEKKDGPFIANLFLPTIQKLDKNKDRTDILFLWGFEHAVGRQDHPGCAAKSDCRSRTGACAFAGVRRHWKNTHC
jgi:hypothetical protein